MIELKNLIATGESSHLEFKSEQVKPEDLAKEIVSFLNFQGGKILLGVEDDGTIAGVSRPDVEEWVINICRNNVVPQIIPGYQKLSSEGKEVVVLDILAQANGGAATVVGMLMFGLQSERHLPQSEVLFAHFKGNEISDDLLDRKSLSGTLPQIIEDAQRVLNLNLQTVSQIEGMKRVDDVIFPDKVLRELIINALLHRRWGLMGNVRIFLSDEISARLSFYRK